MRNNSFLILIFALLVFSVSCKSRKLKKAKGPEAVPELPDTASAASAGQLLGFTLKPWTFFSSKINAEVEADGKSFQPDATIRMYRDSLIWVSAGMYGIEGFRMLITKDSLVLLNKLQKTYSIFKNNLLSDISETPLTVTQIQNILLGRPVFALELYDIIQRGNDRIKIRFSQEKFQTFHSYNSKFYVIDTTTIADNITPNYAEALYENWLTIDQLNIPTKTRITASNGSKTFLLSMQYTDPDFRTELTFPFNIPSSYEKKK